MIDGTPDPNLHVYDTPAVAAHYAALNYLTPCEELLFKSFLRSGMSILDLGVGGGRTTPFLASIARRYVGVDYAAEMVAICRQKFPDLEFHAMNAAELLTFSDKSFDAVVMAFNGMDYVIPDEHRFSCLREIGRVLSNDGILIFSSHNPRAVLVRPSWNQERLKQMAKRLTSLLPALRRPMLSMLIVMRAMVAFGQAIVKTGVRAASRVGARAFWSGEGYMYDSAHGGLETHCAAPENVEKELGRFGFRMVRALGDDYPRTSCRYATEWYYYVFTKAQAARGNPTCA